MLASLKTQQEENGCRASGLSASQIYQYDVSISISSEDASTWTHNSKVCISSAPYLFVVVDDSSLASI